MKTVTQWEGTGKNLSEFLSVGDHVDDSFYYYLLEVVFPASFGTHHVQCGEPADHNGTNGRARFTTIARKGAGFPWVFLGDRERGDLKIPD